ncbi:hypothetical protein DPMN_157514 [Dreissena polymorpha]|uniref:Uncharacterized protein n=1 Tax=Dreissena polymorpha TaxID=45954 RepID=A0A9D4EHD9_DREPO|nr:hypothetical protein DPMN_157514 [Dreissena polymorpha]
MKDVHVKPTDGRVKPNVDKKQEIKSKLEDAVSVLPKFPKLLGSKGENSKRRRLALCLRDSSKGDRCFTFEQLTTMQLGNIFVEASIKKKSSAGVEAGGHDQKKMSIDMETDWLVKVEVSKLDKKSGKT